MAKGIDVSSHNGKPDWNKVKNDGISFAMIRLGIGSDIRSQDDTEFERNVKEVERVGLDWGAYIYSYALSVKDALSEVAHAHRVLKGKKPTLPIAFDMEDADKYKVKNGRDPYKHKQLMSDICFTWLSEMEKLGYDVRLYASKSWFTDILTDSRLRQYKKWVAQWAPKCTYTGVYDMWQYSATGKVQGIRGNVDMNESYINTDKTPVVGKPPVTLPSPTQTGSIVDYMNSVGMDSSFLNRSLIASKEGIKGYTGTTEQNLKLLEILRSAGVLPELPKTTPKPKGDMKTASIVNYLVSIGVDSSFANRSKLATKEGIKGYTGTATQNTALLKKLRG